MMIKHEFDSKSVSAMYDAVCNESTTMIGMELNTINNTPDNDPEARMRMVEVVDAINSHVSIKISVGSHMIEIPNNADFIEELFGYITRCVEDKETN